MNPKTKVVSPTTILLTLTGMLLGLFLFALALSRQSFESFSNKPVAAPGAHRIHEVLLKTQSGFLTDEECNEIRRISSKQGYMTSRVVANGKAAGALDPLVRISEQAWLKPEVHPVVMKLYRKVEAMTGIPMSQYEDMQVVRYGEGGHYKEHYDCCRDDEDCSDFWRLGGRRLCTVLVYLNGPEEVHEGGETVFPRLGVAVRPEKGKMIWFKNIRDNGTLETDSLHAAMPLRKGVEKVACQIWIRQRDRPERRAKVAQ